MKNHHQTRDPNVPTTRRKPQYEDARTILHVMHQLGVKGRDIADLLGKTSRTVHNKLYGHSQLNRKEYRLIMKYLGQRKLERIFGKEENS